MKKKPTKGARNFDIKIAKPCQTRECQTGAKAAMILSPNAKYVMIPATTLTMGMIDPETRDQVEGGGGTEGGEMHEVKEEAPSSEVPSLGQGLQSSREVDPDKEE